MRTVQSRSRHSQCSIGAAIAAWLLAVLPLAGCTVGPKYIVPAAPVAGTYKESPAKFPETQYWKIASPQDAMLRGKWWGIFNDAKLNALEEQLDISNQNIKQAYENYIAARTLIRQARAQYFPTAAITPSFTRSRSSVIQGTGLAAPMQAVNDFSLDGDISWQLDLWGKIRNTVNQYRYAAQVSAADLENIRLALQSSLAQAFFQLRGQDALQKVLDEIVAADRQTVEYARAQYKVGIGDRLALVQAENALQTAEAAAINAGLARAQYEHAIAVLLGKTPAAFSIPKNPLDAVPPPVPVGMPSHLLERRPDVAAAERLMAEANAQIGIAYAAYYPNVTLSASGGFLATSLATWLTWPSRFWSIGASALEIVFDAGLRRATVQQFIAQYNADLASYRQTVLTAFQQVEDYLAAERILSQQTAKQKEAVGSAQEFFKLAYDRYQLGLDPYLNVLTAQTTLLAAQQSLANLNTQRMTTVVQLIAALGGGWDSSALPSPAAVSEKIPASESMIQQ